MKKVLKSMLAIAIAAFAFTSCEDVPMPYDQPVSDSEVIEASGTGTADDPYNVTAALTYVNEMAADTESDHDIYIKGKVVSINTNYDESGTYGNAIFYISDDGTSNNQFYVYRALYLGNKKYTSGATLQEGDEVVICGKVVNYKGTTPETVQSKAYLYSLNSEGGGGGETPTDAKEVTCTEAVTLTNALADNETSTETYAVTGYITEVVGSVSKNQQTFWMADTKDGGRVFEAYWANLPEGVSEFTKGAKVKITGNLTKYVGNNGNVTAEIKNADVEIIEGGSDTPQPSGEAKGSGTLEDPFNPLKATEVATALGSGNTSTQDYYIKGKISSIKYTFSAQYGTATFSISEDGNAANEFLCYSVLYLDNKSWVDGDTQIQVGDEVIICGKLTNYNGTPETASKKAYIYQLNSNGGGQGEQGGGTTTGNVTKAVSGTTVTLTVADATEGDQLTVDLDKQGWNNQDKVATITLSDGTTITFAKADGTSEPAYYTATKGVRIYAKNTITISGKAVAKVVLNCDSYNGTDYVGNSQLYASASGTTFTICNDYTEAKGGVQLRIQTIEITYAK